MFTFLGSHFDVDPLYPWAESILSTAKDKAKPTIIASEKVDYLWQEQQNISSSLFADNSKYLNNLLQTLRSKAALEPFTNYQQPLTERIHQRLHQLYPEKYNLLSRKHVGSLIDEGFLLCSNYNIQQEHEVCWYISLMFILGSRFDIDPKYPVLSYLQQKKSLKEGELTEYLKELVNQYLKSKIKSIRNVNAQQKETA